MHIQQQQHSQFAPPPRPANLSRGRVVDAASSSSSTSNDGPSRNGPRGREEEEEDDDDEGNNFMRMMGNGTSGFDEIDFLRAMERNERRQNAMAALASSSSSSSSSKTSAGHGTRGGSGSCDGSSSKEAKDEESGGQSPVREPRETLQCCICFEKEKSVVFMPCRHMACCGSCGDDSSLRTCPLCRELILHRIQVFV